VKSIDWASAHRPLADYAKNLGDEILVLKKGDRAVAAIVPLRNVDQESIVLSQHPEFLAIITRSRADFAAGRKLSLSEMKRAVLSKGSFNARVARRRRPPGPGTTARSR
jgi:hypothetical protein